MTAATLPMSVAPTVPHATASRAVRRLAVRQIRRGALIVAVVCAVMSAGVAAQYQTMFQGSIAESGLQALAENPAIRILFGPPVALDDAGGFTVWRTGLPVLVLASVWILLAATRITRGEEDAGRWDLLLAGRLRTGRRGAALPHRDCRIRRPDQRGRRGRLSSRLGRTPPARSFMPPRSWASH